MSPSFTCATPTTMWFIPDSFNADCRSQKAFSWLVCRFNHVVITWYAASCYKFNFLLNVYEQQTYKMQFAEDGNQDNENNTKQESLLTSGGGTWVPLAGYTPVWTWQGTPVWTWLFTPLPQVWTNIQSENITSSRTTYAVGKNKSAISICCTIGPKLMNINFYDW